MMRKIPVSATIAHGYGFLVRRVLTILGLSWLPAIFYAAAAGFWLEKLSSALLLMPHAKTIGEYQLGDIAGFGLVTALAGSILSTVLTQDAAERSSRGIAAYFVIGIRERKLFVARLEVYALSLIAILAAAVVMRASTSPLVSAIGQRVWLGVSAGTYAVGGASLIALLALAIIAVRFDFFSGAQVVAEEHAKLSRNWALSRGNFWRLLVVEFFLIAPVLAVLASIAWATDRSALSAATTAFLSSQHDPSGLYQWISHNAAAIAVAFSIGIVASNALFAGASAAAYGVVQSVEQDTPEEAAPYFSDSERAFADYRPRAETLTAVEPPHEQEVFAAEPPVSEISIPMPEFPLPSVESAQESYLEHDGMVSEVNPETTVAGAEPDQLNVANAPVTIDAPVDDMPELESEADKANETPAQSDSIDAHAAEPPIEADDAAHEATRPRAAEGLSIPERLKMATEEAAEITLPPLSSDVTESSPPSVPLEVV
jgi:hypothetical protein